MRNVATNVREGVVPGAGHWLMEESPTFTVAMIEDFVKNPAPALPVPARSFDQRRIAPSEYKFPENVAGTGTSGVSGIQTVVLKGDPNGVGLYTIMLRIPANTRIAAHFHQDDRIATVVSGTWYIGYGDHFDKAKLKALPPGSFYTEPSDGTHFAETRGEAVIVQITGIGPSSTQYVEPDLDPRNGTGRK